MQNEMHSFNHPMYGSYDAFLYSFLSGIKIDEDAVGCDKITVAPLFPQGIDNVNGSFNTVHGKIVSCWKRENGKIKLHVEIPPQTSATLIAGGKPEKLAAGVYDIVI